MNEHILLVDDDQNFRFSTELALKKRGYRICETGDGGDAVVMILEAVKDQSPFDLMLLDMDLPTLSGIEIQRKLFEMKISVPTIVISGHVPTDIYKELLELGCCEIVFKPVNELILVSTVTQLLQRSAQGRL